MSRNQFLNLFLFFPLLLIWACNGNNSGTGTGQDGDPYACESETPVRGDWVVLHILSNPDMLTPFNAKTADANAIMGNIFQSMLDINPYTMELVPFLAKSRPQMSEDGKEYTFEIKDEAVWDDGSPITGNDYAFSIKTMKNPNVNCPHQRVYVEFIEEVRVDPANPKKFTVLVNSDYFRTESSLGFISVIPQYVYDPEHLMDKFTIAEMNSNPEKVAADPDAQKFAEGYNSENFQRETVVGSGAYNLDAWETGIQLSLKRKENWWGDKFAGVDGESLTFENYPDKIVFKIINDRTTALVALRNFEIDVMDRIRAKDFVEMVDDPEVSKDFHLSTPEMLAYGFLGMNNRPPGDRKPFFTDKKVRWAMSHLMDADEIIKNIYYGYAEPIVGPISPSMKEYHDGLELIQYDPEKSKALLDEAGWVDSNGNGIRDKMIDGKLVEFEFEIIFNSGNDERKQVALIYGEECKKVGLKATPRELEWNTMLEKQSSHDFDMVITGLMNPPLPPDLKQAWHLDSWAANSTNYWGFGTPESDSLIDAIRTEMDEEKRIEMTRRIQEIIYDEQPVVFYYAPTNKIAIHKRFRNVETSHVRPGYYPFRFWSCKNLQKYTQTAQ